MQLRVKGRANLTEADAVRYAYRLLSYRDRSEKELEERLRKKGFSEKAVRDAISSLKLKGFLNDAELAESLKRIAEDIKLLGNKGVSQFLQHRGLSKEIIGDVLAEDDSDEIIRAKKLVDRKLKTMGNYPDEEIRKKVWRILARKGYSFDTIRQMLKQLKIEEDET